MGCDELGTDLTFYDLVQTVSAREPVVVLVDQLDALANTVDLTSSRLNDLLVFIARCSRLKNVQIISSCRNFDFTYDPRFRRMNPRTYLLDLPTWDQARSKLQDAGINADKIQPKLQELLRTPQHLSLFLRLKTGFNARTFETYSEMLGEFWNACITSSREMVFVNSLTKRLVDTESIWAPMASIESEETIIAKLCSKGLLERANNQLRFSHQTIQEYAVARLFAESNVSLSGFVLKHQDTLFKRPTIWALLNYLRENAKEKYASELDTILLQEPRLHVKFLLFDFICRQPDPTEREIAIIGNSLLEDKFRLRLLNGIDNSPAWFEAFKNTHLPTIMSDPRIEQWPLNYVLGSAWAFDWETVFKLLNAHWANHCEFDGMTLRVMEKCGKWTTETVSFVERIATRVKQNDGRHYQVESIVGVVSIEAPEDAARLAARIISTTNKEQSESKNRRNSPLEQQEYWYELEEIAKAAPVVFLCEITPWLVSTLEKFHSGHSGSVLAHYAGRYGSLDDRDNPRGTPVLLAIKTSIDIVSREQPEIYVSLFRKHWQSENAVVHRIFIHGLINAVNECTEDVFEYLMNDNRRFTIGQNGDTKDSQSVRLIGHLFPCLTHEQRQQLIDKVRGWSKFKSEIERGESQLVWDRESRLHLLDAIPMEFRPNSLAQFIDREKTELKNWNREIQRSHFGCVKTIPPMNQAEMETACDEELVVAFSMPQRENSTWNRVEGGFEEQGGGEAAAEELSKLAGTSPSRAAEIIRILISKRLTTNIDRALRGFTTCKDRELIFSLVKDISDACDESESYRSIASDLLRSQCDDDGLHEDMIALLESWLNKPWDITRSVVVDGDKKEWKPEQSLLWTNLGLVSVDTDNSYYTLIALTQGLLNKNNPQGDRWISVVSSHLENEVSYKTWRMFCNSLHFVRASYCSERMGKLLIDKFYAKFPQLASETFGRRLLAMLARYLDPDFLKAIFDRLVSSDDKFDQQAAGELMTLCALLDETSEWCSPLLDRHLFPNDMDKAPGPAFLVGVAHAASNLWDDLNKPRECSRIIAQVVSYGITDATNAIRRLFWDAVALPANEQTSAIVQKLAEKIDTVSEGLAEDLLGQLTDVLPHLRPEILVFAQRLVEMRFEELRRREFNAYEVGSYLVEISMTLQRFDDTRSEALDLFEKLLTAGLDEANKALKDVDAVDEVTPESPRMPRRRRRQQIKMGVNSAE